MWLAGKLNEIKQKYRGLATACLLRTRVAFVSEFQKYYSAAKLAIEQLAGDLNAIPIQPVNLPQQQQLSMVQGDSTDTQQQQVIENRSAQDEQ
jgi:hypothetical protein